MASKNSPDPTSHSDPIPINSGNNNRFRQRSASDSSSASESDSVPPLSPSHSPSSSTTAVSFPSQFSSARVPLSPASPSASPIMSFFYGSPTSPNKSFFNRTPFEGADDSSDPNQIKISAQARGLNPSWMPPRFSQHQHQAPPKHPIHPIDSQQERGIGILRRLSLSTPRVGIASKPMITTPQDQTGSTAPHASENVKQHDKVTSIGRPPGHHRRASTLSPGSPNKPRAPSPMGERILKGHYDGF